MLAWKMHKKMRLFRSTFDELYGDGPESDIDQDIYSDNFSDKEEEIQELENNRRAGNHRSRNEGILTSGARLGYVTTAGSKEGRGRPIHDSNKYQTYKELNSSSRHSNLSSL